MTPPKLKLWELWLERVSWFAFGYCAANIIDHGWGWLWPL